MVSLSKRANLRLFEPLLAKKIHTELYGSKAKKCNIIVLISDLDRMNNATTGQEKAGFPELLYHIRMKYSVHENV